jgi:hypothetical protein
MLQIPNLSPLQRAICDMLWSMDNKDDIVDWINTLPEDIVPVAHTMLNLMVYEIIDQNPIEDFSESQEIIDRIQGLL